MTNLGKIITAGATVLSLAGGAVGIAEVCENAQVKNAVVESYIYNDIHEITQYDTYIINGVEVTLEEFNAYRENRTKSQNQPYQQEDSTQNTIIITGEDLDTDGVARLATYLDFVFDDGGKVSKAKIISNDIVKITYEYTDAYESYFSGDKYNSYGLKNVIYQDTTQTNGLFFSVGEPVEEGYTIVYTIDDIQSGFYLFGLIQNPDFADITFEKIFKSITLEVK